MKKFDLIVVGGGSAGIRAARMYASYGKKVALVERSRIGGTCVNVGCVPKKIMSYAGTFKHKLKYLDLFGIDVEIQNINIKTLTDNTKKHILKLNNIYEKMLENSGIECFYGQASFINSTQILVNSISLNSDKIIIATGMEAVKPKIKGSEFIATSADFFQLTNIPKKAIFQGMGYISLEFACILNGLGTDVTIIYHGDKYIRGIDKDIADFLIQGYKKSGIKIIMNQEITEVEQMNNSYQVVCQNVKNNEITKIEADFILSAVGRRSVVDALNLANTKVQLDDNGLIKVDDYFQTTDFNIFALGDTINHQVAELTPVATTQAMNLINNWQNFGENKAEYIKLNYDAVATAMFTNPEFATVGLFEKEAIKQGYDVAIYKTEFSPMHEVLIEPKNRHNSFIKLVVDSKTDKLLGIHIAGDYSAEIVQLGATLIKIGATKKQLDETVGIHPTIAEEIVTLYNKL